jgi:tryptophan 2,3-dioxygenase
MNTTYWDYLQLVPLLKLQGGLEEDDSKVSEDELHFIIVHQVFELWFKLVLRELRLSRDHLIADRVPERHIPHVVRHLRRVNEIFKLSVDAFSVLETLTPQDFLAFRRKLGESSGFQSFQTRVMELLLGLDPAERQKQHAIPDPLMHLETAARNSPGGPTVMEAIRSVQKEVPLRTALGGWLYRTPIQGVSPDSEQDHEVIRRFLEQYRTGLEKYDSRLLDDFNAYFDVSQLPDSEQQRAKRIRVAILFIESYREVPLLAWPNILLETVVELEELLVLWRTRHARMVERIIGRRPGTGGSSGVSYLDATTRYRIFHELWTVRTLLIPKEYVPRLEQPSFYDLMENIRADINFVKIED